MNDPKYSGPVIKKGQPDDTYKFLPLPAPTGNYPYRLNIRKVLPGISSDSFSFHMLGDSGSLKDSSFLTKVVQEMVDQYAHPDASGGTLGFLYHLGDVVYNHGEAIEYQRQFFGPFTSYPAPVFAIPGNHDSDVNTDSRVKYKSLEPFKTVFCDTHPRMVPFSGNAARKSMIQPNIYWTLQTPLANIIGLHSNVPKYGVITPAQREWFVEELKAAQAERPGKMLIVCIHHAPYSADINHGSSMPMIRFFEEVFLETGIHPDIVFSGHVHNYQRFHKKYEDGKIVPFVVAGSGGYDELHPVASLSDRRFTGLNNLFEEVVLERYCDDRHGFLRIDLARNGTGVALTGKYYTIVPATEQKPDLLVQLTDEFEVHT
ncbi:metallophosphoesterase family protein [Dyadobacter sandarakinus]|uniref:metallophosphoesterase family protein n=1 Tax=Dyadobacter sandarakinus TaxID=2747268 RepID=UPI001E5B4DA4|nr:metallophosphoesterase [Dyadobacter sandarakinus]